MKKLALKIGLMIGMIGLMIELMIGLIPFLAHADVTPPIPTISYGILCKTFDSHGSLIKQVGPIGQLSDGTYVTYAKFPYGSLQIEVKIQGPSSATPEVGAPVQLSMRFMKNTADDEPTAGTVVDLSSDRTIALWEPTQNIYLQCQKL